ncbi:DUF3592 domain-containing protein [Microbulbifer litoralis]|uniref:DUF3592 domain-containing protein n=1 Tax=Microbulbifer litoralis TaxID=2933965 RepID=UPI002027DAE7|nr:DUF3592 domain-containing protein [Microbulbifer sp. GX H0434]
MKVLTVLKYVQMAIGVGLLLGAFITYKNTQNFLDDALTAEGVVVDLVESRSRDSLTYRPVVRFVAQDGSPVEFMSSSGSNPPSYYEGETVEVFYQSFAPRNAKINGFFSLWGISIIMGGMGLIFSIIGFSMMFYGKLKNRKIDYLKSNGIPISATFTGIEVNQSLQVNGEHPFRIAAQWQNPATSEIHKFSSENIWFDPSDHIEGDELTVLIEKDNPKKYYLDTSFLPKVAS